MDLLALLSHGTRHTVDVASWPRVLEVAGTALHPLLAHHVDAHQYDIPDDVRQALAAARRANAMHLMRVRRHACEAIVALQDAGATPVVLKGLALAHTVYPSPDTRVMGDVDLWLDVPSLEPWAERLFTLGWKPMWWREPTAAALSERSELGLRFGDGGIHMELHRAPASLQNRVPSELRGMMARRVPLHIGGVCTSMLSGGDMLLHLSLHLADHHGFTTSARSLVDVMLVVDSLGDDFDWPAFAERCRKLGVEGWVATTLAVAAESLGAQVPPRVLERFGIDGLADITAIARAQMWFPRDLSGPVTAVLGQVDSSRGVLWRALLSLMHHHTDAGMPAAERLHRIIGRARLAASHRVPRLIRSLARGDATGEDGARLRSLLAENARLRDYMAHPWQR